MSGSADRLCGDTFGQPAHHLLGPAGLGVAKGRPWTVALGFQTREPDVRVSAVCPEPVKRLTFLQKAGS